MTIKKPAGANFNSVLIAFVPIILIMVQAFYNGKQADRTETTRKGTGGLKDKVDLLSTKLDATNTLIIALFSDLKKYIDADSIRTRKIEKELANLKLTIKQLKQNPNEKDQKNILGVIISHDSIIYSNAISNSADSSSGSW